MVSAAFMTGPAVCVMYSSSVHVKDGAAALRAGQLLGTERVSGMGPPSDTEKMIRQPILPLVGPYDQQSLLLSTSIDFGWTT
jgi:hypothetical protein